MKLPYLDPITSTVNLDRAGLPSRCTLEWFNNTFGIPSDFNEVDVYSYLLKNGKGSKLYDSVAALAIVPRLRSKFFSEESSIVNDTPISRIGLSAENTGLKNPELLSRNLINLIN